MTVYGPQDSWQAFVSDAWAIAAPTSIYATEQECPDMVTARAMGDITLQQAGQIIANTRAALSVARYVCIHDLPLLKGAVRTAIITKLAAADYLAAVNVYMRSPDLTDAEDAILYAAWSPMMPTYTEQIAADPSLCVKQR